MKATHPRTAERRILVPLTFGGATGSKLDMVAAQARAMDARVTLLHVLPAIPLESDRHERSGVPSPETAGTADVAEVQAASFLESVAAEMRLGGVGAEKVLRYGSIVPAVCELAREVEAAMIVVGASEPSGLQRMLVPVPRGGGLAGAISRAAVCPVLVLPRTANAAAA